MVLLKVDLACTFAARFARPDVLEVEAVHGSRMCASTEEFFSSMCTGVGDKTVSNESIAISSWSDTPQFFHIQYAAMVG